MFRHSSYCCATSSTKGRSCPLIQFHTKGFRGARKDESKLNQEERKQHQQQQKKSIGSTSSSSFAITFLIISWPLRFVLWPLEGVSRPPGWEPHAFMNTNMGKYGTYGAHVVLRLWLVAQPQSKHRFKVKGVGLGGLVELTTKLNIDFLPLHF